MKERREKDLLACNILSEPPSQVLSNCLSKELERKPLLKENEKESTEYKTNIDFSSNDPSTPYQIYKRNDCHSPSITHSDINTLRFDQADVRLRKKRTENDFGSKVNRISIKSRKKGKDAPSKINLSFNAPGFQQKIMIPRSFIPIHETVIDPSIAFQYKRGTLLAKIPAKEQFFNKRKTHEKSKRSLRSRRIHNKSKNKKCILVNAKIAKSMPRTNDSSFHIGYKPSYK